MMGKFEINFNGILTVLIFYQLFQILGGLLTMNVLKCYDHR